MSIWDRFYAGQHNYSPWFIGALGLLVVCVVGVAWYLL